MAIIYLEIGKAGLDGYKLPIDYNPETLPLHSAVVFRDLDQVRALIRSGANVNAPGENGWTPLHVAAMTSHPLIIEELIDAGADITAIDVKGMTAADLEKQMNGAFWNHPLQWKLDPKLTNERPIRCRCVSPQGVDIWVGVPK